MKKLSEWKPSEWKQAGEPAKAATAPPVSDAGVEDIAVSTSVPKDVTARGLNSECVVCQDAEVCAAHEQVCF